MLTKILTRPGKQQGNESSCLSSTEPAYDQLQDALGADRVVSPRQHKPYRVDGSRETFKKLSLKGQHCSCVGSLWEQVSMVL